MKRALILCALVTTARADTAGDLVKQGLEEYRAGKYAAARRTLKRAHDLDHKPDTLFALAQAERLDNDCKTAVEHYRTVIQQVPDLNVAKLVQTSLALCPEAEPKPPPPSEDKPKVVTKTVSRPDKVALLSLGAGGVVLGVAGGLLVAASANRSAADKARTLDDHDAFQHSANVDTTVALVTAGIGAGLIGYAVYRWTKGTRVSTDVAAIPTTTGGSLYVTVRY